MAFIFLTIKILKSTANYKNREIQMREIDLAAAYGTPLIFKFVFISYISYMLVYNVGLLVRIIRI